MQSHHLKSGPLLPNDVVRITQYVKEDVGRKALSRKKLVPSYIPVVHGAMGCGKKVLSSRVN